MILRKRLAGHSKNAWKILGNIKRVPFHFLTCRSGGNRTLSVPFCFLVRTKKGQTTEIREVRKFGLID